MDQDSPGPKEPSASSNLKVLKFDAPQEEARICDKAKQYLERFVELVKNNEIDAFTVIYRTGGTSGHLYGGLIDPNEMIHMLGMLSVINDDLAQRLRAFQEVEAE